MPDVDAVKVAQKQDAGTPEATRFIVDHGEHGYTNLTFARSAPASARAMP